MNFEILRVLELLPLWQHPRAPATAVEHTALPQPVAEVAVHQMDWTSLQQSVASCTACGLHQTRKQTVFGTGAVPADCLVIGEAPGQDEDIQGLPFVGKAGQLLDAMLAAISLKRGENVYIANVLKCRPPNNRNPEPLEISHCLPFLKRQIELVQPKLILTLGRFASQALLGSPLPLTNLRGKLHDYQGIAVVVTYHPAYLLRVPTDKRGAWQDLCLARATLDKPV